MQNDDKSEDQEKTAVPAEFLADEAEAGVGYIHPNVEIKLPAVKRKECREIVQQIRDFGVSQRQTLYLIYLLSLELEDRATMLALAKTIGENRENTQVSGLIVPE